MKAAAIVSVLSLTILCDFTSAANTDPLAKVIQLMDSLTAKITREGEEEAKAFKEYVDWCDSASSNLHNEIKNGKAKNEELNAIISKAKADVGASSAKIDELSGSISADEKELKAATSVRDKEVATFEASEKELIDTIDTLDRAVGVLQKEMNKNPAALAQVDTNNLNNVISSLGAVMEAAAFSSQDQKHLAALVQARQDSTDDNMELGAPAASVYQTHSGSIFDVLSDMKEKAISQLDDIRKAESVAKHNFKMLAQSLNDEIDADSREMDEEKSLKAATEERQATAEGDLAETVKELAQDSSSLQTATSTCMSVAADHEATVKSRTEELNAIATARKVLAETGGGAAQQTYSLLQLTSKAKSTLQTHADLGNAEVLRLVKKLAKTHHSPALAQLASRMSSVLRFSASEGTNPFNKIKELLSDMISKLEAEARSEATEDAYCTQELANTNAKKESLEGTIRRLSSKIDLASAKSEELKGDVKTLQAELATLAREQADADAIRAEEKANFDKAKAELSAGIGGVQKAINVLKDYYSGASLVQSGAQFNSFMQQPEPPQRHEPAGGAGGNILNILEICLSDFTKNLASEETEEEDAVAVYQKTTQENELSVTMKNQDVKYKTKEFKSLDKKVSDVGGDRSTTSDALSAVNDYLMKLRQRCVAKPSSYAERTARREAEVKGLQEALAILEDETAFIQRQSRKRHLRSKVM